MEDRYSSGCIESAKQPSPTEKSNRTTVHFVLQNDIVCDLVLYTYPWYESDKSWGAEAYERIIKFGSIL